MIASYAGTSHIETQTVTQQMTMAFDQECSSLLIDFDHDRLTRQHDTKLRVRFGILPPMQCASFTAWFRFTGAAPDKDRSRRWPNESYYESIQDGRVFQYDGDACSDVEAFWRPVGLLNSLQSSCRRKEWEDPVKALCRSESVRGD